MYNTYRQLRDKRSLPFSKNFAKKSQNNKGFRTYNYSQMKNEILKVVTNEKGEAVGEVVTIIC